MLMVPRCRRVQRIRWHYTVVMQTDMAMLLRPGTPSMLTTAPMRILALFRPGLRATRTGPR